MMRFVLVVIVSLSTLPAHAVSRYATPGLTCARIQAIIESEDIVILRYPSPRNSQLTLYDMYASNSRHCPGGEIARPATVPARDTGKCRVRRCERRPNAGNR